VIRCGPTPHVEDFPNLLKRLWSNAGDPREWMLERENRKQHASNCDRHAGGHQPMGPYIPRAKKKAKTDRDGAGTEQHCPDDAGYPGTDAEQADPPLVTQIIQPLDRLRVPGALVIVIGFELMIDPPELVVRFPGLVSSDTQTYALARHPDLRTSLH
jgi:hypothetical protein